LRTNALAYKTRDFDGTEALKKVAESSKKEKPSSVPVRQHLYFESINVSGPKKKILEFTEEFAKIKFPVQFEGLCAILEKPVGYDTPDIGN